MGKVCNNIDKKIHNLFPQAVSLHMQVFSCLGYGIGNKVSVEHLEKRRKAKCVQRHMHFVNVQVPYPHSIIYVQFCTRGLCMKMSSYLFVRA